ncbi:MAG: non-canonical purine NTP pyrophosphatase [Planctomycetota bacterium]|jgi:hypothetical protein
MKRKILVATTNPGKIAELKSLLGAGIEWVGLSDFKGIAEIEEDGATFTEELEFMKAGAVKVCLKAGTGRNLEHNTQCYCGVFQKNGGRNQNSCNILGSIESYYMFRDQNRVP